MIPENFCSIDEAAVQIILRGAFIRAEVIRIGALIRAA